MTIKRSITTNHFRNDRLDRAAYIAQTIGFGKVIKEVYRWSSSANHSDEICQLTETGVIIIRNSVSRAIVTMYIASLNQVKAIYGDARMPSWLVSKVKKNAAKYRENQPGWEKKK